MKNIASNLICILLLTALAATLTATQAAADVTFPDPALDSVIRAKLGLGPADPITEAALAGITELSAIEEGIVDLTGLEYCTSLTQLFLWDNQIIDITPLQGLTSLTFLALEGNQISDLTPLQGLTGLTVLGLSANQISDLTPLQGLTSLESLGLYVNQISDLTPLQGLTGLYYLSLDGNQIVDLTPLQGLTSLIMLEMFDNQISDLTPLQGLTSLNDLILAKNQISDLTPLQGLTNLANLGLRANCISDLSALFGLPAGAVIGVDLNPLSDTAINVQIPQFIDNGVWVIFTTYSAENCTVAEGEVEGEGEGEVELEGEEECVENPEGCRKPLGGIYVIGNDLCLCVPCPVSDTSTYAWTKNGAPLEDGGRVFGANARTLQIIMLMADDSGLYSCTYDDGNKGIQVFNAQVAVVKAMPALGAPGLIVLIAVGSSLGFLARKKRM